MKKIKKIVLILVLFGIIYFVYSYHSENKKYEIISEIFQDTNFYPNKVCSTASRIDFDSETNNLIDNFSLFDRPSAYFQILTQNLSKLTGKKQNIFNKISLKNKSKSPEIICDCSVKMTKTKKGEATIISFNSNYSISFPVLSADNKTAVMQIDTHVGMLGGDGYIYIFKKENGKWKVVEKILQWIS